MTAARVRSSCSAGSGRVTSTWRSGAFAEHDDQAGEPVRDRDEVDPPDVGRARLGRRRDRRPSGSPPARIVAARRNHCSLACWTWPNWWRIISCSTGGEDGRFADRLDEVAVAGVGRDAAGATCGDGSAARPPRGRRGCSGRSRSTRRGGSARRAPADPTGVAVATYSSMTARRIDCARGSSEPVVRTRRATGVASVRVWELALSVCEC